MNDDKAYNFLRVASLGMGKKRKKQDSKYGRFNRRMMAATVDSMVLIPLTPVFNTLFPIHTSLQSADFDPNDPNAPQRYLARLLTDQEFLTSWSNNFLAQAVTFCVLSVICWYFWSATPGKMLFRLKIVDARTEGKPSLLQLVLRASSYVPSGFLFFLGFFWIGIDKRRQGWHDKIADTAVITLPLMFWKKQPVPETPSIEEFGPK